MNTLLMTLNKKNYILLVLSGLLILIGLLLMSGGGSADGVSFNNEMFNLRRTIIAPIVCLAGFLLVIVAIMANPSKKSKSDVPTNDQPPS